MFYKFIWDLHNQKSMILFIYREHLNVNNREKNTETRKAK